MHHLDFEYWNSVRILFCNLSLSICHLSKEVPPFFTNTNLLDLQIHEQIEVSPCHIISGFTVRNADTKIQVLIVYS